MGQSSSQRKAQHRDVELWELYEEDRKHSEHSRRSVDERRRERNTVDGNRRFRESGTEAERTGRTGRDSLDVVSVRRSTAGGNSTGHSGSRRRPEGTGGSNGRMLKVYGQRAEVPRTGRSGGSVEVRQSGGGRQRQRENAVRTGRAGRAGDASQIRYIQPYSSSTQRAGNSAYAYKGNARPVQSIRRRRARRRKELLGKAGVVVLMALCLVMIYLITGQIYQMVHRGNRDKTAEKSVPAVAEQVFQGGPS